MDFFYRKADMSHSFLFFRLGNGTGKLLEYTIYPFRLSQKWDVLGWVALSNFCLPDMHY